MTIEIKNLNGKLKSQENLIKFYQEKSDQEEYIETETEIDPEKKDKIKQLEIKNMKLNEKIKSLEKERIKLENDIDVIEQDLEEEKAINQKAVELINEKDDEIEELKKIAESKKAVVGGLNEEEIQALKEEFLNQQEELDQLREESSTKLKQYIEENNSLLNEISELKDKNSASEFEISRLKETNERLENEKRINEKLLEEKNLKEDNKINEFIGEIQNLQTQLEETQKKIMKI